jgi:hypothetical protein
MRAQRKYRNLLFCAGAALRPSNGHFRRVALRHALRFGACRMFFSGIGPNGRLAAGRSRILAPRDIVV